MPHNHGPYNYGLKPVVIGQGIKQNPPVKEGFYFGF